MNTLEQIIEIIRINQKPFLYLRLKRDVFSEVNVGNYECGDCLPDDSLESMTEKACAWLVNYVKTFPDGSTFSIVIKSAIKANGTGVLGPINFQIGKTEPENRERISGLGTLPMIGEIQKLGYLGQGEVQAMLLRKDMEYKEEIDRREREKLEQRFEEQLESHKASAERWSPQAMNELAKNIAQIFALVTGKEMPGLSGAKDPEKPEDDIKKIAINSFAEQLYEDMSLEEIEALKNIVRARKSKTNENERAKKNNEQGTPNNE
jgi:hypothetical protein